MRQGPLTGLRIIEFAGIGPGPFCGMLLADLGADVVRIDRQAGFAPRGDLAGRGKRSVVLDLKDPEAIETVLKLLEKADALIEGFRPGVMERLGLGPQIVHARNADLVYGRMTGWGQTGPLAPAAGHDINYIALAGALHAMGHKDRAPAPPLNLVGDFGGGALYLAFGICAALLHVRAGGRGQVIDCAMSDGTASLMTMFYGLRHSGFWRDEREANLLDGGAHFYRCYVCADGKYVAIGSIEPQFYALLRDKMGLTDPIFDQQMNPEAWPELSARLEKLFLTQSRDHWCALMEGSDVCFAPVLSLDEAPLHPHNQARATFINVNDRIQPAPAPRFSQTPGAIRSPPPEIGADNEAVMREWGVG